MYKYLCSSLAKGIQHKECEQVIPVSSHRLQVHVYFFRSTTKVPPYICEPSNLSSSNHLAIFAVASSFALSSSFRFFWTNIIIPFPHPFSLCHLPFHQVYSNVLEHANDGLFSCLQNDIIETFTQVIKENVTFG